MPETYSYYFDTAREKLTAAAAIGAFFIAPAAGIGDFAIESHAISAHPQESIQAALKQERLASDGLTFTSKVLITEGVILLSLTGAATSLPEPDEEDLEYEPDIDSDY
jgi:hypothetical protein